GRECFCRQFQIVGEHVQGSAAPYLVVPRRNVYPIPGGLDFVQAASFPLVFQTAWRALRTVGELQPGERVAVIGAGGGTTTAAIQVARASGARVAVVSRSAAKAARAQALGAEAAIVLEEANPLDRALWTWSDKQGVDLIFDSVGGPTLPLSVKALARGGRVVVIGATADPKAVVDLRTLFWRQTSIRGSTMSTVHEFEEMLAAVERRTLVPVIDSKFPFDQAVDAFRRFASGDLFGKVVLELPQA
ncbi:MAG TPA: zinc-binding dehydrogenase, partial [Thermoplasmata archaeon]|nr:zinc-binding dehydrogenase [Thermoplasmata archaeon]